MKIILANGKLGNQMIYYVYYLYFKKVLKQEVKMDLSILNNLSFLSRVGLVQDTWSLEKTFNLKLEKSHYWENVKLRGWYLTFLRMNFDLSDLERWVFGKNRWFKKKYKSYQTMEAVLNDSSDEYLNIFPMVDTKYFDELYPDLVKAFSPASGVTSSEDVNRELNIKLIEKLKKTHSVSIHLRNQNYPGDLKLAEIERKDLNEFINKSIKTLLKKLKKNIKELNFYVFYDFEVSKKDFIKYQVNLPNYEFVDWNRGKNDYYDLQLMSMCKHNIIIAYSSFSWWAAYLNQNHNKLVCYEKDREFFKGSDEKKSMVSSKNWLAI